MKIFNKKVPMGYVLTALFSTAALVYSLGYKMAMDKFNNVVSYTHEKQKMYSALSEIDYNIREDCVINIDEDKILSGISKGYVESLNCEGCKFFGKSEYKEYTDDLSKNASDIKITKPSEDILYIKCNNILNNSSKLIKENIDTAISEGIKGVVIDLRNCNNSIDEEVFKIVQNLAPAGLTVEAVNKKGAEEVVCRSEGSELGVKISVLVNEKTSGACELIAASLKNNKNVKIIGTKTAGNAVRLKKITLTDDSVLVFPDAYYVVFGEENTFRKGVETDYEIQLDKEKEELLKNSSLSFEDDSQVQKAIDWINS